MQSKGPIGYIVARRRSALIPCTFSITSLEKIFPPNENVITLIFHCILYKGLREHADRF